jgi:hypothetical protein
MDRFGLKMNFLYILQVLAFIYIIKIYLQFNFLYFWPSLDWAPKSEKCRGTSVKIPQTQPATRTERGLIPREFRVSNKYAERRGIGESRSSDLGWTCQIKSVTSRNGTWSRPLIHRSTTVINSNLNLTRPPRFRIYGSDRTRPNRYSQVSQQPCDEYQTAALSSPADGITMVVRPRP